MPLLLAAERPMNWPTAFVALGTIAAFVLVIWFITRD